MTVVPPRALWARPDARRGRCAYRRTAMLDETETDAQRPGGPKLASLGLLVGVLVSAVAAGCGGGGSGASSTASQTSSTATTRTTAARPGTRPKRAGVAASVKSGPVRGRLRGANHAPTVNRPWLYSVHVTDAHGRPLSGIVDIQFAFGGQVVGRDTPPSHPITHGTWRDTLKFPASAIGAPLSFRAVVHTRAGSITLGWPITVRG